MRRRAPWPPRRKPDQGNGRRTTVKRGRPRAPRSRAGRGANVSPRRDRGRCLSMPWCPKCRNEYMEGASRCADCQVELVDDLAAHDRAEATAAAERRLRIEGPAEYLTTLKTWLERGKIDVRSSGEALEVPLAPADQVEAALMKTVEDEREGATLKLLGPRADQEPDYQVDPELLRKAPDEIGHALESNLPKLAALLGAGTPRQKGWALQTLRTLEAAGAIPVADFALRLVRSGLRKPLFSLASLLADSPQPGVATRLARELARLDRRGVELALHVLAQLKERSVAR